MRSTKRVLQGLAFLTVIVLLIGLAVAGFAYEQTQSRRLGVGFAAALGLDLGPSGEKVIENMHRRGVDPPGGKAVISCPSVP